MVSLFLIAGALSLSAHASILDYSFDAYNNLLDYKVARSFAFQQDSIEALGDIFLSHNVNESFGLCLLHNHFKIHEGELMVEIVVDTHSTTQPRPIDGWKFVRGMRGDVQPSMMGLSADGDLLPYEFLDLRLSNFTKYTNVIRPGLQSFYSNPTQYDSFFKELAVALTNLNLRHIFGVCVRHRDSITQADPTQSSLETNHPRDRWLRLDPLITHAAKMEMINAKWRKGEASPTYWSFPLRCSQCNAESGICAECSCSGGMCAECGCSM